METLSSQKKLTKSQNNSTIGWLVKYTFTILMNRKSDYEVS